MSKIIEVKNLVKEYKKNERVLDNVSITINSGEIFGLLGPNGAGKSTLVKILTTIARPTSGNCFLNAVDVCEDPLKARKQFGLVMQELTVDEKLSAWDNLYLSSRFYHINKKEMEQRINQVLEIVDLSEYKDKLVEEFSGGMKKRLDIAIALIHNPQIIFLDEPTLGLDIQTRRKIWDYINYLRKEKNTTVFLTTHYMEEADNICDRIAIIDKGKIQALDTPNNLKSRLSGEIIIIESEKNSKEIMEVLKDESYVISQKMVENKVFITVEKSEESIPKIFNCIKNNGLEVDLLSAKKTTLDDVFLHITGNSLLNVKNKSNPHMHRNRR